MSGSQLRPQENDGAPSLALGAWRERGSTGGDGGVTTHPGWPGLRCSQDAGLRTLQPDGLVPQNLGFPRTSQGQIRQQTVGSKSQRTTEKKYSPDSTMFPQGRHLAPAALCPHPTRSTCRRTGTACTPPPSCCRCVCRASHTSSACRRRSWPGRYAPGPGPSAPVHGRGWCATPRTC